MQTNDALKLLFLITVWLALSAVGLSGAEIRSADTLVVCPAEFRPALQPWLDHRTAQGHVCLTVAPEDNPDALRATIRRIALSSGAPRKTLDQRPTPSGIRNLVLIGDSHPLAALDSRLRARTVPTKLLPAKVNVLWGSEPELATDNWYADLDDDRVPDLAVGRLPVDTPAELEQLVRRIIAYETKAPVGSWRHKINFVAGVGGFGGLTDSLLEATTRRFLTEGIPAAYATTMTYGSWQSPFCPDPRRFHDAAVERFNEGCVFWIYIGHGHSRGLDRVHTPGGAFHILDANDAAKLQAGNGCPIALFLACHVGSFDLPRDCLAEEMLRSEGGPIAILSGSRVTMPYAMAVFGDGLMNEFFQARRETLGEIFLHAKRWLAQKVDPEHVAAVNKNRAMLEMLARGISPSPDLLDEERLEHVQLFNLLGDPLLRLPHPAALELETPATVYAGDSLRVVGRSPTDGVCHLELVCRRDAWKRNLTTRPKFDPRPESLIEFMETYRVANDPLWLARQVRCDGGQFEIEFAIPPEAKGHCHVRAVVETDRQYALGASNVFVHATRAR